MKNIIKQYTLPLVKVSNFYHPYKSLWCWQKKITPLELRCVWEVADDGSLAGCWMRLVITGNPVEKTDKGPLNFLVYLKLNVATINLCCLVH